MDKRETKHEIAMEHAKEMLDKGIGMAEIENSTGLDERNINKARRKIEDKDNQGSVQLHGGLR
jgi:hypothetical protein